MLCDVLHVLVLRVEALHGGRYDTAVHVALISVTQQGCALPVVSVLCANLSHTVG